MLDDLEIKILTEINNLMKKEKFGGYIEVNNIYVYNRIEDIKLYILDMEAMQDSMYD